MLVIVGLVVVLGAVLGGFVMAGGALGVMVQPSEFVVIGGAALGSLLVSTPGQVLAATVRQLKGAFTGAGATKKDYSELLALLFQMFKVVQQSGAMGLEAHFEDPKKSTILSKYPRWPKPERFMCGFSMWQRTDNICCRSIRKSRTARPRLNRQSG